MSAMRGSECVIAVDVSIGSQLFRELLLLFLQSGLRSLELFVGLALFLFELRLFLFVVAGVLQHQNIAGFESGDFRIRLGAVRSKRNRLAEQLGKIVRNQLERGVGRDALLIGTAQVAHENEASALFQNVADGGESSLDPGVILDDSVFDRHVEVNAHDDAFAFEIDVTKRFLIHN